LKDGETANLYQSYYSIGHALTTHGFKGDTRITPVCDDSAAGRHEGEPLIVDPMKWLLM
jgi:hypothetical protein